MFNNLKFKTVGYIDLGLKYIEFSHKSFDLINKKNSKFNKPYTVCNLDRKLLKNYLWAQSLLIGITQKLAHM